MSNDEWELLQRHVLHRSDAAFAELVRRYVRLVHGRCLRQLGDPHAAEDVTQGVFLVLADRAAGLTPDTSLTAWLYRVAGFACRNEVKMRARRRRHEAAAAFERARTAAADTGDEADVAALVPLLDAAVDRLGAADRQAVLMRYFEGRTVREVAATLGVPENTAGRRLLRATAKLRATFAAHGVAVPAAAVGTTLAAVVAATAPPAARAAAPAGPAAQAPARAAGRALRRAWWRPLVTAAAAAGVATVATVGLVAGGPSRPATASATSRPVTVARPAVAVVAADPPPEATDDRPESQVPGLAQLAQWDVLLNDTGYDAVRDLGTPVATASRHYAARAGDAALLRRAVADVMAVDGVPAVSHESRLVPLPQPEYDGRRSNPQFDPMYTVDKPGHFLSFTAISQRRDDTFDRRPDGGVRLHLDHPDLNGGVADRPYRNPRRVPGGIAFDGDVAPGRAVWFLGRFVGLAGQAYYHLIVWESFRATGPEAAVMAFPTDAGWWCQHGPEPLRLWADAARLWANGTGSGRPYGPPSASRPLPDGELVWLFALCRPGEFPWCWWDPTGRPAAVGGGVPMGAGPPAGLWAEVDVSPPVDRIGRRPPDDPAADAEADAWGEREEPFGRQDDRRVDDGATTLHIGVPVGPWAEVARLRYGQPVTAGGVRYEVVPSPTNGDFWGRLNRQGVLDDQMHVVAVHRDGTKHRFAVQRQLMWGEPGLRRDLTEDAWADGPPAAVDYFSVRVRQRAFVTFDGFAANPSTSPPSHLARAQTDAALARVAAQHLQRGLDEWARGRVGYALAWSKTNQDWNDGMRVLLHGIVSADEATVRRTLDADDPRAAAALDALAHLACRGESIRSAVVGRFGEAAAHDLLDRPGLFEDLQGEVAGVGWAGTTSSRYHVEPYTDMDSNDSWLPHVQWRQGPTGSYTLDVDDLFLDAAAVDRLAARCRLADDVLRLASGRQPPASLADVRRRLAGGG